LGSHVVKQLTTQYPNAKIRVLDLFSKESSGNIECIKVNLKNLDDVKKNLVGVDCVFNVAALVDNFSERLFLLENNLIATQNIVQACFECNVSTLIHTTSGSVGLIKGHEDECIFDAGGKTPEGPLDGYGESKAYSEKCVLSANGIGNLKTACVGFQVLWGEGDRFMCGSILKGQGTETIGDGEHGWSTVYVDNAVHALVAAYDKIEIAAGKRYWVQDEPSSTYKVYLTQLLDGVFDIKIGKPVPMARMTVLVWINFSLYWLFSPIKSIILIPMSPSMLIYLKTGMRFNIEKIKTDLGFKVAPLKSSIEKARKYYDVLNKKKE
jgi:nucleoside-diphosphate-sugar epimerase